MVSVNLVRVGDLQYENASHLYFLEGFLDAILLLKARGVPGFQASLLAVSNIRLSGRLVNG